MREAKRLRLVTVNLAYDLEGFISAPRVTHRPALPLSRLPELMDRIENYKGRTLTRLTVMLSLHVFVSVQRQPIRSQVFSSPLCE